MSIFFIYCFCPILILCRVPQPNYWFVWMPLTLFTTCNIMHIFGTFILLNYIYVHFCPYFVHIYVETQTRACIYILTLLAVYIVHIVLYFVLFLGSMNSKLYNIMYHCLCVCIFLLYLGSKNSKQYNIVYHCLCICINWSFSDFCTKECTEYVCIVHVCFVALAVQFS